MAGKLITGMAVNGGGSSEIRSANDHYPTPPECTVALMEMLNLPFLSSVWEPACGKGDLSKVMIEHDVCVYSTDLIDYGYGNGILDYLSSAPPRDFDAIITNPPFSIADKFILKAVKEARIVAMLLKSQYWHAKSRAGLFRATRPKYILPLTWRPNFVASRGKSPVMEMMWTVWDSSYNGPTMYMPLDKPV